MKSFLIKFTYVLLFILLGISIYGAQLLSESTIVEKFNVNIDVTKADNFLSPSDIKESVYLKLDTLEGKFVKNINLREVEALANEVEGVESSEAFFQSNGELNLNVKLKKVFIRVKPASGQGYYIDNHGDVMKWIPNYTPKVITVSGDVGSYFKNQLDSTGINHKLVKDLFEFYSILEKDELLLAQTNYINITKTGEVEIIPVIGEHRILLGDFSDIENKIKKINVFYQRIIPKVGWAKYKLVNLKYDHQIVCK